MKTEYQIVGMTCAGCQRAVVQALARVGVTVSVDDVSVGAGTVSVEEGTSPNVVKQAVEAAGFELRTKP